MYQHSSVGDHPHAGGAGAPAPTTPHTSLSSEQGLVPLVTPRSQATKETSLNLDQDDEALLDDIQEDFMYQTHQSCRHTEGSPPLLSPPPPPPPHPPTPHTHTTIQATPMDTDAGRETTIGDRLLSLRKKSPKSKGTLRLCLSLSGATMYAQGLKN